ncbi:sensor histidine kinase [Actinocatenispora rupis]|nr:GAF domain-containing protein [Actinocatenispora rupis]
MLVLVVALALVSVPRPGTLAWCGLLAVAALPGLLVPEHPVLGRLGRIAEIVVVALSAAALDTPYGATLPYLIVPVRAAALFASTAEALGMALFAVAAVLGAGAASGRLGTADFLIPAVLWLLVTVAGGLAGRRMYQRGRPDEPQPYVAATRLLTQLRTVARQLPGGTLDLGGIAAGLLDEVVATAPADRAAVLGRSGGGRLVVLAQRGPERTDWETSLSADTPIAEAWVSQQPHLASRSLARSAVGGTVSALVVPLVAGVRSIGLLVVEADRAGAYPPETVANVRGLVASAALRLEAALLFDEVRALATTEERQRLAREIHDGVAQELVMVGYGIDNAVGSLSGVSGADEAIDDLHTLRAEVTRVITELRLSLFELRTDVDPSGGLATALADYARTVGASSGMRVHLSLDESTARLPATVETELLRIGQEAITNARKHAHAENLWVTCEIDPPYARIEVSDDGLGMPAETGERSYGLKIMAERSRRIRADLRISPRKPSGTTIAAVLGTRPRQGSVSAAEGMEADNV